MHIGGLQALCVRPLQVILLFLVPARMLLAIFRLSISSIVCILHAQSWKHPGTETEIPLVVALATTSR